MSERALITGGAGCIGSVLAERLVARGDQVTVIDDLSSGRREHIAAIEPHRNFRFVEADVLDVASLDVAMAGTDTVYHLAANPDVKYAPGDPTDKDLRQNTIATYRVLETMRRHGVRRLAFASTSAVYGRAETLPILESAPTRPISLYGATKLACEGLIGAFQNLFDMECRIFRFANIVGPRVRAKGRTVIGDFIARLRENPRELRILGDGNQSKSYLSADECVDGIVFAMERAGGGLGVFNLGCEGGLTVRRIADLVALEMGLSDVRYGFTGGEGGWPGDVPRFELDVSAMARLGWHAGKNSEQAVVEAIRSSLVHADGGAACAGFRADDLDSRQPEGVAA